jgi:hypothetical protein
MQLVLFGMQNRTFGPYWHLAGREPVDDGWKENQSRSKAGSLADSSGAFRVTGMRILCVVTRQGSNALFCVPSRTGFILLEETADEA